MSAIARTRTRRTARKETPLELVWVKPPQQERSRDTQHRIVAAAHRLLARGRSWEALTVADLVAEAETSIGAFYNRFRDKDALLHVLQLELYAEGEATAARAREVGTANVPLPAVVRAFVELAVTAYRDQRGLRRALLVQMCGERELRRRSIELSKLTCAQLVDVVAHHVKTRDRARIATVVDVCHRIVYATLDQELLYDGEAPTAHPLDDAQLVDELAAACLAYLERRILVRK